MSTANDSPELRRLSMAAYTAATRPGRRGNSKAFKFEHAIVREGWLGQLTRRQLAVLFALNTWADASLRVTCGHTALGKACGLGRNHAATATAELERLGLVKVIERGRTIGTAGKRTSNVYELPRTVPPPNSPNSGTNRRCE